jgi:CO/xanthine dehydrogenase FAD-binding subunit
MKPAVFEYCVPRSAEEALSLLAEYGDEGRILAGGQSLVPLLNFRLSRPSYLIDLNRCAELGYVRHEQGQIIIGAMVRQSEAEYSELVRKHCPLLREALAYMGHPTIRHRGTVGGSLAHADPGAELPTIAMALGAEIVLRSAKTRRTLTPDEFFLDSLVTAIEPDEMLVEARFPVRQDSDRHAFVESGVRRADLAIAGVAAQINVDSSGVCTAASIVALGGGTRPTRLPSVEAEITGRHERDVKIGETAAASEGDVDPPSDLQASTEYRRKLIATLTRRALQKLFPDGVVE